MCRDRVKLWILAFYAIALHLLSEIQGARKEETTFPRLRSCAMLRQCSFFAFVPGMSVSKEMLSLLTNINLIWLRGAENSLTAVVHGCVAYCGLWCVFLWVYGCMLCVFKRDSVFLSVSLSVCQYVGKNVQVSGCVCLWECVSLCLWVCVCVFVRVCFSVPVGMCVCVCECAGVSLCLCVWK